MSAEIFGLLSHFEKKWEKNLASSLFDLKRQPKKTSADIWCLVFGFSHKLIQWKEHMSLVFFFSQYTDPNQIKLRAEIIGKEIGAAPGKKLSYMENKELTELDRQLITTSR